jgi:hypothetical protein
MAFIRVKNNHTGDEGLVDETWLVRWPDDFTPIKDDAPAKSEAPSDGNPDKEY